ncbi:glyoxylase-like metal-dependent hydrolase (beta-lactamase superfamily II) [Kutzneria viridogrisea]|uniref:Glyoxylase-like metal-dependent hydrolase (Beta-lactamase superfamily II) n=1 Tax=Kutzneria viridogrisea TaxID=47990 RepID=A0ABR6BDT2_9PSEU|nr:glyoxylase-like metal-dependent hydrolase (beta-lactamase superfamily II) [Kutzneria viridogrisea]
MITFTNAGVAPCSTKSYEVHRCGDTLFPGGVGKTSSPENFTSLLNDVQARLFDVLPDDTWVYPGHGDDTTLGAERPKLAEWRERGW